MAVAQTYTYCLPADCPVNPQIGLRVLVPLGPKRIYTGIIAKIYAAKGEATASDALAYKEIFCFLEDYPMVTPMQLKLWEWLSSYYMCSLGEVMRAGLPAALKPESETRIRLNKEFQAAAQLPRLQTNILDLLSDGKPKSIEEISRRLDVRTLLPSVNALLNLGAIFTEESVHIAKRKAAKRLTAAAVQPAGNENPQLIVKNALNSQQERALGEIRQSFETHNTTLLHGVTSSGKTEVYIHLIQEAIDKGQQVLYLVPEIALTTQLTERLRRVFGDRLGVYHSRLNDRERVELYKDVLQRRDHLENADEIDTIYHKDVIIGVRSALFLPFQHLGFIIVDEEHDASYKQQDPAPRYHARSAAIMLASFFGAKTLLGTATPAIETYYNALHGKFGLVKMMERYRGLSLPEINVIDLQEQYRKKEMDGHFSTTLTREMKEALGKGKQVILFQNRRGYSSYIECKQCAYIPKCVNCDVSLTEHKFSHTLVCHYCGYTTRIPTVCPACQQVDTMADRGFGTEMIEEEVEQYFNAPSSQQSNIRTVRMDQDTTRNKNSHQKIIDDFAAHKVDVLIGTQMVTKGLHFDDVTLVAVLKADALLHQPDFRATERAYQMLEQVAGRAGRTEAGGKVVLQTMDPSHPIYSWLQKHDYEALYHDQIAEREAFHYPPFHRIICLTLRHRDISRLETAARTLHERLTAVFGARCSGIIIPNIAKMQNQYARQLVLRIETSANFQKAKEMLAAEMAYVQSLQPCKGTIIIPDVEPM